MTDSALKFNLPGSRGEFRGQFDAISTKIAGARFSQHMKRLAEIGDKLAVIHSIRHVLFSYPDDTIVHPGHGPDTTIGTERRTNPFLT